MRTATFEELNCVFGSTFGCQSTLRAGRCSIASLYFWWARSLTVCLYEGMRLAIVQLLQGLRVNNRPLFGGDRSRRTHVKMSDRAKSILVLFITNMPLPSELWWPV